jgi:hypothetical protein
MKITALGCVHCAAVAKYEQGSGCSPQYHKNQLIEMKMKFINAKFKTVIMWFGII